MTESAAGQSASVRTGRLRQVIGDFSLANATALSHPGPLIGLASSRLGYDLGLQHRVCRYLSRSVMQCRARGGQLLIARDSAIEPWARRAAELFAVPCLTVTVDRSATGRHADRDGNRGDVLVQPQGHQSPSRDAVLIALADRIDSLYVRRGGSIETLLRSRLERCHDATTRVAVHSVNQCAAASLIARGAVGWYEWPPSTTLRATCGPLHFDADRLDSWVTEKGEWLVHCTRGFRGPWPGETLHQFHDAMLLGTWQHTRRGPLDSLIRIVRSGRLVASAETTRHDHPVVCFSELPLAALLARRCYRSHLGRWDYEPYGIAVRRVSAVKRGIQPVIYGEPGQRNELPAADRFRFHPCGKTHDWKAEKEWRSPTDVQLADYDRSDVRLFVRRVEERAQIPASCPWRVTVIEPTSPSNRDRL